METELRKTVNKNARNLPRTNLEISFNTRTGGIFIYKNVSEIMNLDIGDAIMFSINRQNKTAYIYKEKPEGDNYHLKRHNQYALRINNKELTQMLKSVFDSEAYLNYLNFNPIPDEKNRFKLTLK